LDLSVVLVLLALSNLPIIIDPSHATGYSKFFPKMAKAAIVAGTDYLLLVNPVVVEEGNAP